jgi:hypothetical protein
VCDPVVASFGSGAISAIGGAQEASAQNAARKRDYEYKLKIRENRWMRDKLLYSTKKVQYQSNLDEANIAAQRAYTQSQINLNNIRSQAMLDHSEDFKSMLKAEGLLEAQAAERGVRGKSINRAISSNIAKLGLANAARTRALTQTLYRFNEANDNVKRQLRSRQNQLFGQVAISPVPDIPSPPPVMQNVGAGLFLGLASAGFDAYSTHLGNKAPTIRGYS